MARRSRFERASQGSDSRTLRTLPSAAPGRILSANAIAGPDRPTMRERRWTRTRSGRGAPGARESRTAAGGWRRPPSTRRGQPTSCAGRTGSARLRGSAELRAGAPGGRVAQLPRGVAGAGSVVGHDAPAPRRRDDCAEPTAEVRAVTVRQEFSAAEAQRMGEKIGIDWAVAPFDVEQLRMGMNVELEHGLHDERTKHRRRPAGDGEDRAGPPERVPRLLHAARAWRTRRGSSWASSASTSARARRPGGRRGPAVSPGRRAHCAPVRSWPK